jgi:hypothetical protein
MLAVLGRNIISQAGDLSKANLPNPDSYYKLVILKDYTPETGFQFIARDNAPYGSWIHWSLPHTWSIWQLHRGLMAFGIEKDVALLWAGGGLTLFSMLLLALFVALAVANVGSPLAAVVSGLVVASSPPLFGYGQLVQITHHIFMLVPVAAAAACFLRPSLQAGRLLDFIGGALLGVALWISPETMPLVFAFSALRAAICLQHASSGPVWPVAAGLMVMVLTGWAIDPPPPTFSAWALDHISFAWLLFSVLLASLLLLTDFCIARGTPLPTSIFQLVFALVVLAIAWLVIVPAALAGPNGLIPNELRLLWYDRIEELQAVSNPSQWVAYLLLPLISAGIFGYVAWRERSLWMLALALSTLIYGALGAGHIRMGAAAALMSALAFSIGISQLRVFKDLKNKTLPMSEQIMGAALILIIPLQTFGTIGLEYFEPSAGGKNNNRDGAKVCLLDSVLPLLNSFPASTLLANSNNGPEILFKTRHRIIAGNYHHNVQGLIDYFDVYRSVVPNVTAQSIVATRNINFILTCAVIDSNFKRGKNERTLAQRMAEGEAIDWLPEYMTLVDWRIYWRSAADNIKSYN